tara:strand:+ start:282 stop:788 length:507 start_codon:yes stop_codon:yes gene_type:complete
MKKIILIFLITFFTNYSFAYNDDLSGNAIDCYIEDDKKIRYYITIKFISDKKSLFAFAIYDTTKNEVKEFLGSTEVDYYTGEYDILLVTPFTNRYYNGYYGVDAVPNFSIDRRDLSTNFFMISRGGFLTDIEEGCEIADYDNPNLFEIYNKLEEMLNFPEFSQEKKLL